MKRLVRQLLEAWDQWIDADGWHGPELDRLAETVKLLRDELQKP